MNRTLEITTRIGCRNDCYYCPQDKLLKAYTGNKFMSIGQFWRILDNTPKDIQIDFAGFCEPFLNPVASLMMKYAISEGYKVYLLTTLSNFTKGDEVILQGCHFDTILIHEYQGKGFNKSEQDKKLRRFLNIVTADKVEQFPLKEEYWFSRAGNLWDREELKDNIECGWDNTYSRNVVLPNCDVYLCCMDYGLTHKIGNLWDMKYEDLDRSKPKDICRKCEIAKPC